MWFNKKERLQRKYRRAEKIKAQNIYKNLIKIVADRNELLKDTLRQNRKGISNEFKLGQLDMLDKIIKEYGHED